MNILKNCISFIPNEDALKNEIIPNLMGLTSYLVEEIKKFEEKNKNLFVFV
jgi:hypothetical protein